MEVEFNPAYEVQNTPLGKRCTFFCELTGVRVCTTEPVYGKDPHRALQIAQGKAKTHFNRCPGCGRWVCDNAFNMDEGKCVECAPFTRQPIYCTQCGAMLKADSCCCLRCGYRTARKKNTGP